MDSATVIGFAAGLVPARSGAFAAIAAAAFAAAAAADCAAGG